MVTEWFNEHESYVNHMPWSSQSPDLNPIEHLQYERFWSGTSDSVFHRRVPETALKLFWFVVAQRPIKTLYVGVFFILAVACMFTVCEGELHSVFQQHYIV